MFVLQKPSVQMFIAYGHAAHYILCASSTTLIPPDWSI